MLVLPSSFAVLTQATVAFVPVPGGVRQMRKKGRLSDGRSQRVPKVGNISTARSSEMTDGLLIARVTLVLSQRSTGVVVLLGLCCA